MKIDEVIKRLKYLKEMNGNKEVVIVKGSEEVKADEKAIFEWKGRILFDLGV